MRIFEGKLTGNTGDTFAIVVSRFNDFISERLLDGCLDTLRRHSVDDEAITVIRVPGSFEIPLMISKLAKNGSYSAIIGLGALIKGSTPHFEYIAAEVTKGIASVSLETATPCIFGVITADTLEQAIERAGTKSGNKGVEAARSALEMADLFRQV